jgi:hypothetical protein
MEAYQDYLNMFNFFNIGTIVFLSLALVIFYVVISIIKHQILVNTIKKAVKSAIKELNEEDENKLKQSQPTDNIENNVQK